MKSLYLIPFAALAACAVGCSGQEKSADTETVAEETVLLPVEVSVASRQDVPQMKSYTATVEAENTNNIASSMPNRIKTITVDVGDHVRKGQTVATLDRSNITQLKLSLDNAQREYDRAVKLLQIGSGTQQQVDQLKTQLDATQSQYDNMLENTVLVSPISGVVTARNYDPGDMTGQLPIVTVGQITPSVKVMINITENDFTKVKTGLPVEVTFDAFPEEVFKGKISRIYPTVDPNTRTFQTEILINNPQGQVLPGMFARVSMDLGSQQHVVVPDLAVVKQTGSGNKYVYVYSNGKVTFTQIELGQRLGDSYELLSGIQDGDTVVVAGQSRLIDGAQVEVVRK
ncbi:MAG: efflux RND transporter periplasmic adaptor subunit [Muribaculaceae bacterium]|nr:efflux RND transporter periplasmic adaptor subunit [Muribaculaceae bacterium]